MSLYVRLNQFFKDGNFNYILYCNILAILAIILLYFYYQIYKNSSLKKSAFITELIEDLDKSPIFDLENDYKKFNESNESFYDTISFGKWKGSNVGCLCKEDTKGLCSKEDKSNGCKSGKEHNYKSKYIYDFCHCPKLTKGDCSEDYITINCKTVEPNPEIELNIYKKTWFYAKRKYRYKYSYIKLLYSNNIIGKNQKPSRTMAW